MRENPRIITVIASHQFRQQKTRRMAGAAGFSISAQLISERDRWIGGGRCQTLGTSSSRDLPEPVPGPVQCALFASCRPCPQTVPAKVAARIRGVPRVPIDPCGEPCR